MIYYCPHCWREVKAQTGICPFCRGNITMAAHRSFDDKLIAALHHPEPQTPLRVSAILGKRKTAAALPALRARLTEELKKSKPDPYLAATLIKTIYTLGGLSVAELRSYTARNYPLSVRLMVHKILSKPDDKGRHSLP